MASALAQAKQLAQYNNKLDKENVKLQYSYNKALAEQDRSWQEKMANSAHQREIADLKKAGLNPVLSLTGGNGAPTPTGSSASVSKPSVDMSLPAKVMDYAMAQLSSATELQKTTMQSANNLAVAQTHAGATMYSADRSFDSSVFTHTTPGANTLAGMIANAPDYIIELFGSSEKLYQWLEDEGLIEAATQLSWKDIYKLFKQAQGHPQIKSKSKKESKRIKKAKAAVSEYKLQKTRNNYESVDDVIARIGSSSSSRKESRKARRSARLTARALRRYERKYG